MWNLLNQITRHGLCTEKLDASMPAPTSAEFEKPSCANVAIQTYASSPPLHSPVEAPPEVMQQRLLKILGRALTIRAVDAGSCNGCELEMHALSNPYYNLEGAGLRFVASPRHADMLLVTGPVTRNMEQALRRTIDATPRPRLVVALGECACTGGLYGETYATRGALSSVVPVDLTIPGCPPKPGFILHCILSLMERLPRSSAPV